MRFRAGDCDGHGNTFILRSVNHFCVDFEVCFGSLTCWKVQPQPILKGPYYENSSFLVLLHVHLGIWRVYQPKNAGKKPLAIFVMVPGSLLWSETS